MANWKMTILLGSISIGFNCFSQQIEDKNASQPLAFSLKQAQEFALVNNLNVKNALLDLESAKKKVWETTAIGLPQVTASGNYQHIFKVPVANFPSTIITENRVPFDPKTNTGTLFGIPVAGDSIFQTMVSGEPFELGVKDNFTWDITATQLLFSGEYIVGLQASRTFKELSEKMQSKVKFDTRETVTQTYILVLVGEENLSVLRSSLELMNKSLTDMEAMKQQGFLEETEVDQIQISKINLENMVGSVSEQVKIAYRLLKFQMGIDMEQPIVLTDSLNQLVLNGNFDLWSKGDFDVQKNIDYQIMKTQEGLSSLSLKREKSKFLPTIAAFYKHQEQVNEAAFNFFMPDIFGASITLPIFTSGMRTAQLKQAQLALEKTTNSKNLVMQGLILEYEQSLSDYNKALNDYLTLKQSVELADKIYRKTILKYSQGMVSAMDLTQSQNQLLSSEANYYNAILTLFKSQAKLEKLQSAE